MSDLPPIGMAKPGRAKRHHIFKVSGGRSLCGAILGWKGMPMTLRLDPAKILKLSPGDCWHCVKVFNAVLSEVRHGQEEGQAEDGGRDPG